MSVWTEAGFPGYPPRWIVAFETLNPDDKWWCPVALCVTENVADAAMTWGSNTKKFPFYPQLWVWELFAVEQGEKNGAVSETGWWRIHTFGPNGASWYLVEAKDIPTAYQKAKSEFGIGFTFGSIMKAKNPDGES